MNFKKSKIVTSGMDLLKLDSYGIFLGLCKYFCIFIRVYFILVTSFTTIKLKVEVLESYYHGGLAYFK